MLCEALSFATEDAELFSRRVDKFQIHFQA